MSAVAPAAPAAMVLSGLARAMVQQQLLRLDQAMAIQKQADASRRKTADEVIAGGEFPASRLARFASDTFGLPLMDLNALDVANLPPGLIDARLQSESRIIPVSRRNNRLTVLLSDPTDLQAIDRVKFQAQAAVDPIVVEHDKLMRLLEKLGQSASQQLSDLVDEGFAVEFSDTETVPAAAEDTTDVDDAPIVRYLQKVLMDAINVRRIGHRTSSPTKPTTGCAFASTAKCGKSRSHRPDIKDKLASRIKVLARLDISEKRGAAGRSHEAPRCARAGEPLTSGSAPCRPCSAKRW